MQHPYFPGEVPDDVMAEKYKPGSKAGNPLLDQVNKEIREEEIEKYGLLKNFLDLEEGIENYEPLSNFLKAGLIITLHEVIKKKKLKNKETLDLIN
jgi:hypothetical protein